MGMDQGWLTCPECKHDTCEMFKLPNGMQRILCHQCCYMEDLGLTPEQHQKYKGRPYKENINADI